jgi:hypothetical protein
MMAADLSHHIIKTPDGESNLATHTDTQFTWAGTDACHSVKGSLKYFIYFVTHYHVPNTGTFHHIVHTTNRVPI